MLRVSPAPMVDLDQYESISIAQTITQHLDRPTLIASGGETLVPNPVTPYVKDYDACEEDRPTILPTRFDTQNWATIVARDSTKRLGGAILAHNCPGFDLLENRRDIVHIVDLRVAPEARGQGIGKAIFEKAIAWSLAAGCAELRVETQDTNPGACRFYSAMGCRLHSAQEGAYGPDIDELKLIWSLRLHELPDLWACHCCGLLVSDDAPWGENGLTPTFTICPCCGIEYGLEDMFPATLLAHRARWLARPSPWFSPRDQPPAWNPSLQIAQLPLTLPKGIRARP